MENDDVKDIKRSNNKLLGVSVVYFLLVVSLVCAWRIWEDPFVLDKLEGHVKHNYLYLLSVFLLLILSWVIGQLKKHDIRTAIITIAMVELLLGLGYCAGAIIAGAPSYVTIYLLVRFFLFILLIVISKQLYRTSAIKTKEKTEETDNEHKSEKCKDDNPANNGMYNTVLMTVIPIIGVGIFIIIMIAIFGILQLSSEYSHTPRIPITTKECIGIYYASDLYFDSDKHNGKLCAIVLNGDSTYRHVHFDENDEDTLVNIGRWIKRENVRETDLNEDKYIDIYGFRRTRSFEERDYTVLNERPQLLFFDEHFGDIHFNRIDTMLSVVLGILPESFIDSVKLVDTISCEALYYNESVEKVMSSSHIQLGRIYRKTLIDRRPNVSSFYVGISDSLCTKYIFKRNSYAFLDLYLTSNIGDTVLLQVSDEKPRINRVLNWHPTHEEIASAVDNR